MIMPLKPILVIITYAVIFINILVSLISGVVYWTKTGDYKPALRSVAEPLFGADVAIAHDCNILNDKSLQEANPEKYDKGYLDYLRSNITHNLLIFALMFFLVFKVWEFLFSASNSENKPMIYLMVILVTIMTLALIEVVYSLLNGNGWIIPLRGIIYDFPKSLISGGFWNSSSNFVALMVNNVTA